MREKCGPEELRIRTIFTQCSASLWHLLFWWSLKPSGVFFQFLNSTDMYAGSLFFPAVSFDTFFMQ